MEKRKYHNLKVKDAIEILQKLDQDKELVFYSSEEGNSYKVPAERVCIEEDIDYDDDDDCTGSTKYLLYVG